MCMLLNVCCVHRALNRQERVPVIVFNTMSTPAPPPYSEADQGKYQYGEGEPGYQAQQPAYPQQYPQQPVMAQPGICNTVVSTHRLTVLTICICHNT